METQSSRQSTSKRQKREKATIDHLVDEMYQEKPEDGDLKSPTTDGGLPVEEQVRKEWDPNKNGGLPTS